MIKYHIKGYISVILLYFIVTSCDEGKNNNKRLIESNIIKTIEVKLNATPHVGFSEHIKSIHFIRLETTESSLLRTTNSIIVDKQIYFQIFDSQPNELLIFSKNGKFLRKTIHGRGPGEVMEIRDFQISENGNISILGYKSIKVFDENLVFKKKYDLPIDDRNNYINPNRFCWFSEDNYYTWVNGNPEFNDPGIEQHYHLFKMGQRKSIESFYPAFSYTLAQRNFLLNRDNNYYLLPSPYDDYILEITPEGISKRYIMNFGEKKVDFSQLKKGFSRKVGYDNLSKLNQFASKISLFIDLEKYLIFKFFYNKKIRYGIYNKKSSTTTVYSSDDCIIDEILPFKIVARDRQTNNLIGLVEPSQFLSYIENNKIPLSPSQLLNEASISILQNVSMEDNPILISIELKN